MAERDLDQLKSDEKVQTAVSVAALGSLEYITRDTEVYKALSSTCGILVITTSG